MTDTDSNHTPPSNLPADAPWWARWLVAEWKDFWKWLNTWLIGTLAGLPGVYELMPEKYQAMIPASWMHWVMVAVGVATFINLVRKKKE